VNRASPRSSLVRGTLDAHADRLFLATLDQIEELIRGDEFEVPAVAGHLRKLLLDRPSLVELVNRPRGLRICFVVNGFESAPFHAWPNGEHVWAALDAVEPMPWIAPRKTRLAQGAFLDLTIMAAGDVNVTVQDLIKYVAYVRGGVHPPRAPYSGDPVEQAATRVSMTAVMAGYSTEILTLRAVARIVLRGLAPLRRRARRELVPSVYHAQRQAFRTLPIVRPHENQRPRGEQRSAPPGQPREPDVSGNP
jgi:hypothetical protein